MIIEDLNIRRKKHKIDGLKLVPLNIIN